MKLDKTCVYSLEDLTSEERKKLYEHLCNIQEDLKLISVDEYDILEYKTYNEWCYWHKENSIKYKYTTHNAKELFYTLANVAVLVNDLTKEQKNNLESVFVSHKYFRKPYTENKELISYNGNYKHEITYDKFMELFAEEKHAHYDNTNGSIYKFCNDQKLNSWEFDIIKRVVRCRKKGLFKEDLQKTKDLIDLYLKEFTDEK